MRVNWVFLALMPVLLLAACGSDDEPEPAGSKASAGFPVTIEHARGKTVIPAAPKRVVTIGYTDHEILLALGIRPVGAMDWFGERPYGKWPWEKPRWGGDTPEIIGAGGKGYNVEKIASLRPDLIIGLYAGADDLDKATYDKLSQIAPTVGPSPEHDDYTTPWQEMTRVAGRAVGKEARANELIAGIERRFADVRRRHPEFADQTAVVVDAGTAPKAYWAFASDDPRGQFMRDLGFKPSPAIDKTAGDKFGFELSPERLELLDVDRLVLLVDPKPAARLKADRLFRSLKVAREERVTYLRYYTDPPVGAALAFNSVLSIPYGIDGVLPLLAG
jgi:iron complex transport system substrate-binding protein